MQCLNIRKTVNLPPICKTPGVYWIRSAEEVQVVKGLLVRIQPQNARKPCVVKFWQTLSIMAFLLMGVHMAFAKNQFGDFAR